MGALLRVTVHGEAGMSTDEFPSAEFVVPGLGTVEGLRALLAAHPGVPVMVLPGAPPHSRDGACAAHRVTRLQRSIEEFSATLRGIHKTTGARFFLTVSA